MNKSLQTFLMIASAAVCIGAVPLAMSQFGSASAPGKGFAQAMREWRDSVRSARRKYALAAQARRERTGAQEAADLEAVANYRMKFAACQQQATGRGLHFLERMSYVGECMHNACGSARIFVPRVTPVTSQWLQLCDSGSSRRSDARDSEERR